MRRRDLEVDSAFTGFLDEPALRFQLRYFAGMLGFFSSILAFMFLLLESIVTSGCYLALGSGVSSFDKLIRVLLV